MATKAKVGRGGSSRINEKVDTQAGTATLMLVVAERLFAEHGIENVPMQQIVSESRQRNRSALNYHFGARPDVVAHIVNLRLPYINALRHKNLDLVEAQGMRSDVHAIADAAVQAVAYVVRRTRWGQHFIQVLAQASISPKLMNGALIDPANVTSVLRYREMLQAALPAIPRVVLDRRIVWFTDNILFAIARTVREEGPALRRGALLDDLVDYCASGICAQVTNETMARSALALTRRSGVARFFR